MITPKNNEQFDISATAREPQKFGKGKNKLITIYEVANGYEIKIRQEANGIEVWDEVYVAYTYEKVAEIIAAYLDRGEKEPS